MELLSKPIDFDFNEFKKYEEFNNFRFSLTERNWIGESYVPKEKHISFLEELKVIEKQFYELHGKYNTNTLLDFLIDTSVFVKNSTVNTNLISFLDVITMLYGSNTDPTVFRKESKKDLAKLHDYANRPENYVYLLKWCYANQNHIFSSEIFEFIQNNISQLGIRNKNLLLKETKSLYKEVNRLQMKGLSKEKAEIIFDEKAPKIIMLCEQQEAELFSKIFKHAFEEPLLFYYATHIVSKYYSQMDKLVKEGNVFLSMEREHFNKEISVFVKDSTTQLSDIFLMHESFLKTFPRSERNSQGTYKIYYSLHDLKDNSNELENEKIEVLKTIVSWVASRIPNNKLNSLPNKKWIHMIKTELLKKNGITHINFESNEFIGGINGKELLIKAMAYTEREQILFPVFAPTSWDNLNSLQCNLMAYAICLYHDICIENNYELIRLSENFNDIEYELVTKDFSPYSALHLNDEKNQKNKKSLQKNEKIKNEHWVSFHFRQLLPKYQASEEAKKKAERYGIKTLPKGFTFVDSFIRGDKVYDVSKMKISALDVLNRTLDKINIYDNN